MFIIWLLEHKKNIIECVQNVKLIIIVIESVQNTDERLEYCIWIFVLLEKSEKRQLCLSVSRCNLYSTIIFFFVYFTYLFKIVQHLENWNSVEIKYIYFVYDVSFWLNRKTNRLIY